MHGTSLSFTWNTAMVISLYIADLCIEEFFDVLKDPGQSDWLSAL